jgi:hypothetical protein
MRSLAFGPPPLVEQSDAAGVDAIADQARRNEVMHGAAGAQHARACGRIVVRFFRIKLVSGSPFSEARIAPRKFQRLAVLGKRGTLSGCDTKTQRLLSHSRRDSRAWRPFELADPWRSAVPELKTSITPPSRRLEEEARGCEPRKILMPSGRAARPIPASTSIAMRYQARMIASYGSAPKGSAPRSSSSPRHGGSRRCAG